MKDFRLKEETHRRVLMCVSTSPDRDPGGPDRRWGQADRTPPPRSHDPSSPSSSSSSGRAGLQPNRWERCTKQNCYKKGVFPQKKESSSPGRAEGASRGVPAESATQRPRRAPGRAGPGRAPPVPEPLLFIHRRFLPLWHGPGGGKGGSGSLSGALIRPMGSSNQFPRLLVFNTQCIIKQIPHPDREKIEQLIARGGPIYG